METHNKYCGKKKLNAPLEGNSSGAFSKMRMRAKCPTRNSKKIDKSAL